MLAAVCFFYLTVVLRTLAEKDVLSGWLGIYLAVELLFGLLFTLVLWRPIRKFAWQNLYFIFQTLLALFLLVLHPHLDFTNVLLVLLTFQAVLVFPGRARRIWVAILLLLIILSLTILLGIYGLALALLPSAAGLILAAYVANLQEIETGQNKRQALLAELQQTNRQLTDYASQIEELSAIQERNRLARELHDSVSQTMFSINLHSQAARILFERDPEKLRLQLEQLQVLTHNALNEMRSLITDMRLPENETIESPTA
jgi:signal transduction histidine kinase